MVVCSVSPHSVESGGRPLPLADTTIPKWYFQSRTKDWEKFRLGTVSPSESDGLANGGSRVGGLIRYRDLDPPQCFELKVCEYVIIKEAWLAESHTANAGPPGCLIASVGTTYYKPRTSLPLSLIFW
jgi:hypothetical protein